MAKSKGVPTVAEVLAKVGKKQKTKKGTPAKKKTPAWNRYKTEDRFFAHQKKQMKTHIAKYPNDLASINRLRSLEDKRYGVTK